jgi:hypothetical protein
VVSFKDKCRNEEEIKIGGNHFRWAVYLRMAEAIIEELKKTPPQTAELRPMQPNTRMRLP